MRHLILRCIVLFIIREVTANIQPLGESVDTRTSITDCILEIGRKYFKRGAKISIITPGLKYNINSNFEFGIENLIIENYMKETRWNLYIKIAHQKDRPQMSTLLERDNAYILLIQDKDESDIVLRKLLKMESWNPHAKFLIFVNGIAEKEWESLIIYILASFWKHFVINVTIMLSAKSTPWHSKILTWMPFAGGDCGHQPNRFIQVGTCQNSRVEPSLKNLFPNKVPFNLNGCPLPVLIDLLPPYVLPPRNKNSSYLYTKIPGKTLTDGFEVKLIKTIAERRNLNISFYLTTPDKWRFIMAEAYSFENTKFSNNSIRNYGDVAIGAASPLNRKSRSVDFSYPYAWSQFVWVVSNIDVYPHWIGMIHIFRPSVWAFTVIVCSVVSLSMWCVAVAQKNETEDYTNAQSITLTVIGLIVNITPSSAPRTFWVRWIFIFWLFFCSNWTSAYTSSLVSRITAPLHVNQIKTYADIKARGMTIGATYILYDFFNSERQLPDDKILKDFKSRYEQCSSILNCMGKAANNRSFASIENRAVFGFLLDNFITENGEFKLRALRSVFASRPIVLVTAKGFPLLAQMDSLIRRISESGLLNYWQGTLFEDSFAVSIKSRSRVQSLQKPLTMEHLMGAFFLLGIGIAFATSVFAFEIICRLRILFIKKMTQRRQQAFKMTDLRKYKK